MKIISLPAVLIALSLAVAHAGDGTILKKFSDVVAGAPDISGPNLKVWSIKQDPVIRVNLIEMSGELGLHMHPDATHSLMVLSGKVRVQAGNQFYVLKKGDYISIPATVPHKYCSLTKTVTLVSMDAPYYNPSKTVPLK